MKNEANGTPEQALLSGLRLPANLDGMGHLTAFAQEASGNQDAPPIQIAAQDIVGPMSVQVYPARADCQNERCRNGSSNNSYGSRFGAPHGQYRYETKNNARHQGMTARETVSGEGMEAPGRNNQWRPRRLHQILRNCIQDPRKHCKADQPPCFDQPFADRKPNGKHDDKCE